MGIEYNNNEEQTIINDLVKKTKTIHSIEGIKEGKFKYLKNCLETLIKLENEDLCEGISATCSFNEEDNIITNKYNVNEYSNNSKKYFISLFVGIGSSEYLIGQTIRKGKTTSEGRSNSS